MGERLPFSLAIGEAAMTRKLFSETVEFGTSLGEEAGVVHTNVLLRLAEVGVAGEKVAVSSLQDVDLGEMAIGVIVG